MIGDNFEVISTWEAETDTAVCSDDVDIEKNSNSEGGSLVDPRVMSLSRALESGQNGKVGAEKTFRNSSSKHTQAKTKVSFKLQAVKNLCPKTKSSAQKPDWSKLKQKLKEVNDKQILQKQKVGKEGYRIPFKNRNPSIGSRIQERPICEYKAKKYETEKKQITESSESIMQDRKRELEKLCSASEPVTDLADFKPVISEMVSDTEIEMDSEYEIDGYSVEICRYSTDEDQSKEPSVDREMLQGVDNIIGDGDDNDDKKIETIETSGNGPNVTGLTVTSGIIPNLYITGGLPSTALDDKSRSPPVLEREYDSLGREQCYFVIANETVTSNTSEENIDQKVLVMKDSQYVDNGNLEDNDSIRKVKLSKAIETVGSVSPALLNKDISSSANAQTIHAQNPSVQIPFSSSASSSIDHDTTLTPGDSDKVTNPAVSVLVAINSTLSSLTDAILSDSAETLNYSELTGEESLDSIDSDGKKDKENRNSPMEAPVNLRARLYRSLSSSSLSSENDSNVVHSETSTFDTQVIYPVNNLESYNPVTDKGMKQSNNMIPDDNLQSACITPKVSTSIMNVNSNVLALEKQKSDPGADIKRTNVKRHKDKLEKSFKKKKKNLERNCNLENDSDDLPKIRPPKRRHRSVAVNGTSSTKDYTQERLLHDLPNHNWLFNKYSVQSSGSNATSQGGTNIASKETVNGVPGNQMEKNKHGTGSGKVPGLADIKTADHLTSQVFTTTVTLATTLTQSTTEATIPASVTTSITIPTTTNTISSTGGFNSGSTNALDKNAIAGHQNVPKCTVTGYHQDSKSVVGQTRNQETSQLNIPGSLDDNGGIVCNFKNKRKEIDVLKTNGENCLINLHYSSGFEDRQQSKLSTGIINFKIHEKKDQNAPGTLNTYQSRQKWENMTNYVCKSDSCDKTSYKSDMKTSVEGPVMEKLGENSDIVLTETDGAGHIAAYQHTVNAVSNLPSKSVGCETGHGSADSTSVQLDVLKEGKMTNETGNSAHPGQEVDTMATENGGSVGSKMDIAGRKSPIQSDETENQCSDVGNKEENDTLCTLDVGSDLMSMTSPDGNMSPIDLYHNKPGTVESGSGRSRQKPNPPVLRVQPHLYKPPGSKCASAEPPRSSMESVNSASEVSVSTKLTQSAVNTSSSILASSRQYREDSNMSQENFAQNNISISHNLSATSTVITNRQRENNIYSQAPVCEPLLSKTLDMVPVQPVLSASSNCRTTNTGIVNPVQPIMQTQRLTAHKGQNSSPTLHNNGVQTITTNDQLLTSQDIAPMTSERMIIPPSVGSVTPVPFMSQTQTNQSYLYHQQPAIIRVQTPTINPVNVFEINPISQITPLPQSNQVYLLDSGNSVIPITSVSTASAQSSGQHVLATVQSAQDPQHLGQIISSRHIIIAQPVGTRPLGNAVTEVEHIPIASSVNRIKQANDSAGSDIAGGGDSTGICGDAKNEENKDNVKQEFKKEAISSLDEAVALSDDDEDFKRQLEEIEKDIKRKEKEREEMRNKRLMLLEQRKAAKTNLKVKTEENPDESSTDKETDIKSTSNDIDEVGNEEFKNNSEQVLAGDICDEQRANDDSRESIVSDKSKLLDSGMTSESASAETIDTEPSLEIENQQPKTDIVNKPSESEILTKSLIPNETDTSGLEMNNTTPNVEQEDEDNEEDPFEGALVIDLSATSKEHGSSSNKSRELIGSTVQAETSSDIHTGSQSDSMDDKNEMCYNQTDVKNTSGDPKQQSDVTEMSGDLEQQPDVKETSGDPKQQPDVTETSGDPIQQPDVEKTSGDPIQQPDVEKTSGDSIEQPAVEKTSGDSIEQPDVEKTSGDSIEQPDVEKTSGDSIEQPDVEKTSGDSIEQPDVEKTSGDSIEQPDVEKTSGDQIQQPDVRDNTIEYIADIRRINPFTGELESSEGNSETLDLSNKPQSGLDSEATKADMARTFDKPMAVSEASESNVNIFSVEKQTTDKFSENNGDRIEYGEDVLEVQEEDVNESDNTNVEENESLDLSIKAVCVFTFKETEVAGNLEFAPDKKDNKTKESNTQVDNQTGDKNGIQADISEHNENMQRSESTSTNRTETNPYKSNTPSVITGDVACSALSTLKEKDNQIIDNEQDNEIEAKLLKESNKNPDSENLQSAPGSCEPLKVKEEADPEIVPEFTTLACHASVTKDTALSAASISNSMKTNETNSNQKVTTTSVLEKVPITTSKIQTAQTTNSKIHAPVTPTMSATRNQYRHRQIMCRPPEDEQGHFMGFHGPPKFMSPQGQRLPGHPPVTSVPGHFGHPGPIRMHEPPMPMIQNQPVRNMPVQGSAPFQLHGNNPRNTVTNRGQQTQVFQSAQKRSKGMYLEIEPAHTRPPPKKIPRGAKPAIAHNQVAVSIMTVFRKMNKSFCPVPPQIMQSGPYFKRKDPVFEPADEREINSVFTADTLKSAHCQKPFSIAGQLIVSRRGHKRNSLRELVTSGQTRQSSVPNTPQSPVEVVQRPSSAKPDIPFIPHEGHVEVALPSQSANMASPIRAHSRLSSDKGFSMVQVLRPPSGTTGKDGTRSDHNEDVIDLTSLGSPKVEPVNKDKTISSRHLNTETAVQSELNAALAKRLRLDQEPEPVQTKLVTKKQPTPTEHVRSTQAQVGQPLPPPPLHMNYQVRMQQPVNRPIRVRQPDYSHPRQVLAPVPVERQRVPVSMPYSPVHQNPMYTHQSNMRQAQIQFQERETGIPYIHQASPRQAQEQPPPKLQVSGMDQRQHKRDYMAHRQSLNMNAPASAVQTTDMRKYPDPSFQNMYQQGRDIVRQHPIAGNNQHNVESLHQQQQQHPFIPAHPLQQDGGQGQMHYMMQQNSPRGPMVSPNPKLSPQPPSPRGDVAQNWPQFHKMQQIRANHLRNRQLQTVPQQNRDISTRQGYPNNGHSRVAENFPQVQTAGQGFQVNPKQAPQPFNTGHMQGMEQGPPLPPYPITHPVNNQQIHHGMQMTPPLKPMGSQRHQQVLPNSSTRYHLGPPEAQYISTSQPQQTHGHSRGAQQIIPLSHPNHSQTPVYNQGYPNQNQQAHSTRTSDQASFHRRDQYIQEKQPQITPHPPNPAAFLRQNNNQSIQQGHGQGHQTSPHNTPHLVNPASLRQVNNHLIHQGHGQSHQTSQHNTPHLVNPASLRQVNNHRIQQGHGQGHQTSLHNTPHSVNPASLHQVNNHPIQQGNRTSPRYPQQATGQSRGQQIVPEKMKQHIVPERLSQQIVPALTQEEESMPHLQQVHGTCVLCGKYSLYLCSSCKKMWYCSPECQLKHWQTHANECKGPG